MYTVLFICTANICRTPMAVALLRDRIRREGLEHRIDVLSAGTWAIDGAPPAEFSAAVCRENDLDCGDHAARAVDLNLLNRANVVLCMTTEHQADLTQIFPHFRTKIFTLREFAHPTRPERMSIQDPYGRAIDHYRTAFREIAAEVERIWPALRESAALESA